MQCGGPRSRRSVACLPAVPTHTPGRRRQVRSDALRRYPVSALPAFRRADASRLRRSAGPVVRLRSTQGRRVSDGAFRGHRRRGHRADAEVFGRRPRSAGIHGTPGKSECKGSRRCVPHERFHRVEGSRDRIGRRPRTPFLLRRPHRRLRTSGPPRADRFPRPSRAPAPVLRAAQGVLPRKEASRGSPSVSSPPRRPGSRAPAGRLHGRPSSRPAVRDDRRPR